MRAAIVAGVLGIGTVLVFGAALLTASLFPNGTTVSTMWNGGFDKGWGGPPVPVPFDPGDGSGSDGSGFQTLPGIVGTLPGDIVVEDPVTVPDSVPMPGVEVGPAVTPLP